MTKNKNQSTLHAQLLSKKDSILFHHYGRLKSTNFDFKVCHMPFQQGDTTAIMHINLKRPKNTTRFSSLKKTQTKLRWKLQHQAPL